MKILHTADWHLGAKTNGKDRLPEQRRVLDEIISIVNYENIDVVIIAGDIFNSSSPSADAEELFFDTVQKLSSGADRFIFVLAGNHDDPTRLSAGLPLSGKHNIMLASDLKKINKSIFTQLGNVKVLETGSGYVRIITGDETATIAFLPYPSEARFNEKVSDELSYSEKVRSWANVGASSFVDGDLKIFVSHLFLTGSKVSDDELRVGNLLAVSKDDLPQADYTALGHIHRGQDLGDNVFYSGAITALSVNEKNLSVKVIETKNNKITNIKTVKLNNPAKYETVKAKSLEEADEKLEDFDDLDLVELEISQSEPLSASGIKEIKKKHPAISTISLKLTKSGDEKTSTSKSRKSLSDEELFHQFYEKLKGISPTDELVKMFLECKGGLDETEDS